MSAQVKSEYDEQAEQFLSKFGISISKKPMSRSPRWDDGQREHGQGYEITLSRTESDNTFTFDYWDSLNNKKLGIEPSDYSILSCLGSDSYEYDSFEDFCSNCGYDTDSRKAYATWEAVNEQTAKIVAFFSPEEIEPLQEIQ